MEPPGVIIAPGKVLALSPPHPRAPGCPQPCGRAVGTLLAPTEEGSWMQLGVQGWGMTPHPRVLGQGSLWSSLGHAVCPALSWGLREPQGRITTLALSGSQPTG